MQPKGDIDFSKIYPAPALADHTHNGGGSSNLFTGTYTGDGTTSKAITGVGFQPIYVKIWERLSADGNSGFIFETTDTIIDDYIDGQSWVHSSSTGHFTNTEKILSLDSDGFTVSDKSLDADPNKDTIVYNFLCIG